MKRSQMKRKITGLLKHWQGSILDGDTSEAILQLIEKNGMMPPGQEEDKITFKRYSTGEVVGVSYEKYEWEKE